MMNDKDKQAMEVHGITFAPRNVYFYKEYKYDRLEDAVRYAEIDARRASKGRR
jgi:hypothetical protein